MRAAYEDDEWAHKDLFAAGLPGSEIRVTWTKKKQRSGGRPGS